MSWPGEPQRTYCLVVVVRVLNSTRTAHLSLSSPLGNRFSRRGIYNNLPHDPARSSSKPQPDHPFSCPSTPCTAAIQCSLPRHCLCVEVVVPSSLHGGDSDTRVAVCCWTPTPGAHPVPPRLTPVPAPCSAGTAATPPSPVPSGE
jgi:hypothetical protein